LNIPWYPGEIVQHGKVRLSGLDHLVFCLFKALGIFLGFIDCPWKDEVCATPFAVNN
jgi:hypothetical protein